ncbi:MAG: XRE family transcriptional regulator [Candidatus Omnitrophota bacterium]
MDIGEKIRGARQEKRITLAELSEKSGVAQATLSRIENGLMTGTVKSHMKICEALGIDLTELYGSMTPEKKSAEIESGSTKKDVFVHDEKSFSVLLTSQVLSKKMMPILIRLAPEGKTPTEEAPDGTEKFLYCISGNVAVTVGGETYPLNTGDRLYFNASLSHRLENKGKTEARCLSVSSPPAL